MNSIDVPVSNIKGKLYSISFLLAILTIILSISEAVFSTYYGFNDESTSLFGFGIDSFIEVISAAGVASMISRIRQNEGSNRSNFEKTALRITGFGFYILVAGLIITSIYNIWTGHNPTTTFPGVVISAVSIVFMFFLYYGKTTVGKQLHSAAILADASCTKVCIYMSLILLLVSGLYVLVKIPYLDALGSLTLAFLSYKEGRECFEKATSEKHCCC